MDKDYYEILDVRKDATTRVIREAFRRLVMEDDLHLRSMRPEDEAKYMVVGEAVDVLSNNKWRLIYDEYGEDGLKNGVDGLTLPYIYHGNPRVTIQEEFGSVGSLSFSSIFSDISPSDTNSSPETSPPRVIWHTADRPSRQCDPSTFDLDLEWEHLLTGYKNTVKVTRTVLRDGVRTRESKNLPIDLRPGWRPGKKITFPQEGHQDPDKLPGDVIFTAVVEHDTLYEIDGDDIRYINRISLVEALCGTTISAPLLEGGYVIFKMQNQILYHGMEKRLPNKGLPLEADPSRRGDLVVTVAVDFPSELSISVRNQLYRLLP